MVVFDSSAVIALLQRESGAAFVASRLPEAIISAVNVQEIAKKLIEAGTAETDIRTTIAGLQLDIRPHDIGNAYQAASLATATRQFGCGLGDRSCMALAIKLGVPAITTDRAWAQIEVPGLEVILAR